jgi:predicted N-acetyltransferase YhbS
MPYPDDVNFRSETLELLGRTWTKLPGAVVRARASGADWFEVSTPFVEHEAGRIVAHVGVLEIPVVLDNERRTVAGIHAVCTHQEHRRRGHMRAAMERALAWVDARYETAVLWANDPEIYGRFGFVAREESMFVGSVQGGPVSRLQPLMLDQPDDVAFLRERLADRVPVSLSIAANEPGWLELIDLALWTPGPSLAYLPDLECIVVYAVRERFLDLHDVIARDIPPLADIAARLGERIDTAVVYFSPDLLEAPGLVGEPTVLIDSLMVRGRWVYGERAFAFSPLGRC